MKLSTPQQKESYVASTCFRLLFWVSRYAITRLNHYGPSLIPYSTDAAESSSSFSPGNPARMKR